MAKLISVPVLGSSEVKSVMINVDQIVSVVDFKFKYRVITTAIEPGAHGPVSVSYDVSKDDFDNAINNLVWPTLLLSICYEGKPLDYSTDASESDKYHLKVYKKDGNDYILLKDFAFSEF